MAQTPQQKQAQLRLNALKENYKHVLRETPAGKDLSEKLAAMQKGHLDSALREQDPMRAVAFLLRAAGITEIIDQLHRMSSVDDKVVMVDNNR